MSKDEPSICSIHQEPCPMCIAVAKITTRNAEQWRASQIIARLMAAVAEKDPGEPEWIEQAMREGADYVEEAKP